MISIDLNTFLNELSSSSPTPGGGSAAAVVARIACSLLDMLSNLTLNKKAYQEKREMVESVLAHSGRLQCEFVELIDKDINAFNDLMASFKLPKEAEAEKQEAIIRAATVPMQLAKLCVEGLEQCAIGIEHFNKNVISDGKAAAALFQACIKISLNNVDANLPLIKDKQVILDFMKDYESIERKVGELSNLVD